MKYIIIGLGSFGSSLAQKLTAQGNEVIGIDIDMSKVENFREKITHTICLDATDEHAVAGLPLRDTDTVMVAIGEDQGANIMTSALLKNLKVQKLLSRAIDPLHEKVLVAIGVDEIVRPEEETAGRWARKLNLRGVVDSFELNDNYSVVEAKVPNEYVGKSLGEIGFQENFKLLVLTIMKNVEVKSMLGKTKNKVQIDGLAFADQILEEENVLVLFGANKDLQSFLKHHQR